MFAKRSFKNAVVAVGLLLSLLATTVPAFANHEWTIAAVQCNGLSHTIKVFGDLGHDPNGYGSSNDTDIFVNGTYLTTVYNVLLEGYGGAVREVFAYSDPSFVLGATITIANDGGDVGPSSATTVCNSMDLGYGPTIPTGFLLRTIICNTSVYNQAGGNPVSSGEKITSGQTWFVSGTPVIVGKASWTEVFVGGYTDGFIRTSCIGKKPADYAGP